MQKIIYCILLLSSLSFSSNIDLNSGVFFQLTTISKNNEIEGLKHSPSVGLHVDFVHGDRLFRALHRIQFERVGYRYENRYENGMTGEILLGFNLYNLRFEKNNLAISLGLYGGKILKRINAYELYSSENSNLYNSLDKTLVGGYDFIISYSIKRHSISFELPYRYMYYTYDYHEYNSIRFTYSFKLFSTKKAN